MKCLSLPKGHTCHPLTLCSRVQGLTFFKMLPRTHVEAYDGAYIHPRLRVAPPTFLYLYPVFPETPLLHPPTHYTITSQMISFRTLMERVCARRQWENFLRLYCSSVGVIGTPWLSSFQDSGRFIVWSKSSISQRIKEQLREGRTTHRI